MQACLELFHDRTDPKEELENWGSLGPIFGPPQFVHTTYTCDIKFNYADESQRDGSLNVTNTTNTSDIFTLDSESVVWSNDILYSVFVASNEPWLLHLDRRLHCGKNPIR